MNVGENIKELRIRAGLTQKEVSEKLNVSFQTVSKWENNTNEPDIFTLREMSKLFNCTVDDLIALDLRTENNANEVKKEKCIINVKRVKRIVGKEIDWQIYIDGNKVGNLENKELASFDVEKPGEHEVIIYHPFNAPDTKPLSKANVTPLKKIMNVSENDHEITLYVNINAGMFKSSLILESIERN